LEIANRANKAQKESRDSFRKSLTDAEKVASKMAGDLFGMLDNMPAHEQSGPPYSNTGVTNISPPAKKTTKNTGKGRSKASGGEK
jgi:hypothetical protein